MFATKSLCLVPMISCLTLGSFGFSVSSFASGVLLAQQEVIGEDGYNKTYNDDSKSFQERMGKARSTPDARPTNEQGGFNLGLVGAFGPVYNTASDAKSGIGVGFGVEPGFVIQNDMWNKIELGLLVGVQSLSWKNDSYTSTMTPLVVMPRVGLGHGLGGNLMGVARLGFGMGMTGATSKDVDKKFDFESPTGLLASFDYDVVYGGDTMQFFGGLGVIHQKYDFKKADFKSATENIKNVDVYDGLVLVNFVNLHGGLRFQF